MSLQLVRIALFAWLLPLCGAASSLRSQRVLSNHVLLGHLQSGPDSQGSSFASETFVDRKTETLHIVGTTYGKWFTHDGKTAGSSGTDDPACFYAVVQLPNKDNVMDWIHTEILGVPSVEEGCRSMVVDMMEKRAFLVGHSDTDGLLEELFDAGGIEAASVKLVGQILDYKFESSDGPTPEKPLELQGGRVIQESDINYPVAVAGLPGSETIYVASMHSTASTPNHDWEDGAQMDPSEFMKYGSGYYMTIHRYNTDTSHLSDTNDGSLKRSVGSGISRSFATDGGEEVHVAALVQLPDRLIVAGHTSGTGTGFTAAGQEVDAVGKDGFVTQLDLTTLQPMLNAPTFRVTSGRDDYVTGVCYSDQTPGAVYVTGYSKGHVGDQSLTTQNNDKHSIRAYIMKLRLEDMSMEWIQEFEATPRAGHQGSTRAKAISCSLSHDGKLLYVVGNVENGAYMADDTDIASSFGGTDVWIAQIDAQDGAATEGNVNFVKQLGSEEDDSVAFRGGVQVDKKGNAVMIGNTKGEVYRQRGPTEDSEYADVFFAMFDKADGTYVLPVDHDDFVSLPPKATLPPTVSPQPTPPPTQAPKSGSNLIPEDATTGDNQWIFLLVLLLVVIVAVVCFIIFWNCYHIPKRDIATDRSKVLDYLHDFDVDDVELKHSATGGWHCSYVNDLAQGINRQAKEDSYTATAHRFGHDDTSTAYDPLNASAAGSVSGGHSTTGSRRTRGRRSGARERFSDEIGSGDEEVISFGSSRDTRRERRSKNEALIGGSTTSSEKRSRKHRSRDGGSVSSGKSGPRINRAKERWENREII